MIEVAKKISHDPIYEPHYRLIDGYARLQALEFMNIYNVFGSPFPQYLSEPQYKYIARDAILLVNPFDVIAKGIISVPLNKKRKNSLSKKATGSTLQLIGAFYNTKRREQWWRVLRQIESPLHSQADLHIFICHIVEWLYDAVGYGFNESLKKEWRTPTVMNLIKEIRYSEDWSSMPILADALQEADCNLDALLAHLRNPEAKFTLGGWLFRSAGVI